MDCLRCNAKNRPGRRYCANCGTELPVACAACGFANEVAEKFCGGCGATLAPTGEAKPESAGGAEGERRPVTVLFADLVDYTRLAQALELEDVHALLGRFYETVDAIVERCGGSVDKHIGDALMAVFGAPVAHGDEALRAVRAADEIQRAVPALGVELRQPLAVHIGIAAGEVVASGLGSAQHRSYTVIGHSVNLAARLLNLAHAGETVLDDAVHAATRHRIRCTPIEGVELKGIDAPLTAWRFVEFRDTAAPEGTSFVGRAAELAQLATALQSCATSGTGATILIRGDAGIGKSRLLGELQRRAQSQGFASHTGLVLDFGIAEGRDAIREVVAGLLQLAPGADALTRGEALERALAEHKDGAQWRPFLTDLLDLPQSADARALYEAMDNAVRQRRRAAAVVRVLQHESRRRPVLIVVEDVHWADPITLDYLAALTRAMATMPAVLLLTTRPEGDPLDWKWRASVEGSPLLTIDLGPLAATDAQALADGFVSASRGFARKCIERAGGNPLFLEQLLRAAGEEQDRLPMSLASLVLARMDRLPERDRVALRAAAVIGQRFSLSVVRRLSQFADYDCGKLVEHQLIRPEGDEYLFAHALIRDGVYASLTRARRAELHRAAADWYGERDPTLRAEHLDRAEAPEAPQAYLAAARAQWSAFHLERALALAERGAGLARDPADVHALNMLRGSLRFQAGEGMPAIDAYQVALAAALSPADRCRALLGIAAGHRLTAGVDAAFAALAEAEPIAVAQQLTRELAELHYTRGNLHFARAAVAECRAEHEAALACAQSLGDPEWEARALSGLADADYAAGRMRTALGRFAHCVALCDAHGMTRVAIPNRVMIGHCRCYVTEFDAGPAEMEAALALAVQVGDKHAEMFALESLGVALTLCGRYAEAEPVLQRSLNLAEAVGARRYQALVLACLAQCRLERGHKADACEMIERALAIAHETGMGFGGPLILGLKLRMIDDPQERERCEAEAEVLLNSGSVSHNQIGFWRHVIEDALDRGDWPRALKHAASLEDYTRAEPLSYCDFVIARCRAIVGLAARPDDAATQGELARLQRESAALRWPIGWPDWAVRGLAPPTQSG